MTLPELAIKRPVTTLMILVSIVVLGAVALTRLPLAFMPDIVEPELFVQLPYENASPEQVERMIVRPVEDALGSVKGLQSMWSRCGGDGGRVRLDFDWGTDMHLARVEVWERIDRIRGDLPEDMGDIQVTTNWDPATRTSRSWRAASARRATSARATTCWSARSSSPWSGCPAWPRCAWTASTRARCASTCGWPISSCTASTCATCRGSCAAGNFDQSLGKIADRRQPLHPAHRGHLRHGRGDPRTCPCAPTACGWRDVADVVYEEPPLEYGRHLDGDFAIGVTVTQESRANTVEVCDDLQAAVAGWTTTPSWRASTS